MNKAPISQANGSRKGQTTLTALATAISCGLFVYIGSEWFWFELTEPQIGRTYTQKVDCDRKYRVDKIERRNGTNDLVTFTELNTDVQIVMTRSDFKKPHK